MPLRSLLTGLKEDRRGASVLELGLMLPILTVMLLGIVDVASCYSAKMSIQQAAARALERAQVTSQTSGFSAIRQEAADAAGVPLGFVTIEEWLECNYVRQGASITTCSAGQVRSDYLKVTIVSTYTPFFSMSPLGQRLSNGNVQLSTTYSLRVA